MPFTTNYQAGDIVLVDFPFTVSGPGKPRPALVILDAGDADVLLARVTTQLRTTSYDISLAGWQQAGLLAPSVVRLHKLATLAKSRIQRHLGRLETNDHQQVATILQKIAATW
ncbi:MAG TPA: type II toxin-antitoxin system PemK/MazF family toxin [Gemmataceae bacterium]|nr:type II toxin-antitoxin system PemK/MazF family toxin [Gemmataceae bacterium]